MFLGIRSIQHHSLNWIKIQLGIMGRKCLRLVRYICCVIALPSVTQAALSVVASSLWGGVALDGLGNVYYGDWLVVCFHIYLRSCVKYHTLYERETRCSCTPKPLILSLSLFLSARARSANVPGSVKVYNSTSNTSYTIPGLSSLAQPKGIAVTTSGSLVFVSEGALPTTLV